MRNPICNHCEEKHGFCWIGCKKYKEAQLKKAERRFAKRFGDDFDAEDRYVASLMFGWAITVFVVVMMLLSFIKQIGEWIG